MSNHKKAYFRVIGDVHGKHDKYIRLASDADYSLQIGDLGFEYSRVSSLDPTRHRVIGGNHDNYTNEGGKFVKQPPHFLGDFGVWVMPGVESIFYVRGGWSIDRARRIEGRDWWPEEELSYSRGLEAVELYKALRPKFVVTHCCPESIVPKVPFERLFGREIFKTRTDALLETMYDAHQPVWWIFGHYHVDWNEVTKHPRTGVRTRFICLDELSYKDIEPEEIDHEEGSIQ